MVRLTRFELSKVWRRRGFLPAACLLLALNLFLLWYTSLPGGRTPPLSAYRSACSALSGMTEAEKADYLAAWKETLDGVAFVGEVLSLRGMGDAWAAQADQTMAQNPGVFETYYDLYASGDYLRFTVSPEQETALAEELYGECTRVAGYGDYLRSIRERRDTLGGISVFGGQDRNTFSSRNIEKSAADYARLTADGLRWAPSRPVASAIESVWTDLLLVLLSLLFVGCLITEEKGRGLFYITRATRYGVGRSIAAKLLALLVHCLASAAVFFAANCLFFGLAAGWCDMAAPLQSLAPYLESSLPITVLDYLVLSVLTKGLVLFAAGSLLTALCILSPDAAPPYLAALALWALSWALYRFIPGASALRAARYLNLFALLRPRDLYGTYLNLDLLGYPVSHVLLSWAVLGLAGALGAGLSVRLFCRGGSLTLRPAARRRPRPFRPHAGLLRHEGYKVLAVNRALLVLLLFTALIGYREAGRVYTPSAQERYYQSLMLQLEGPRTPEKDRLLEAEAARYENAFAQIRAIEQAAAAGEIDGDTADAMKAPWYGVTAFYPAFRRAEEQRRAVLETGGTYLYDTGWLYLMGVLGGGVSDDFLLLTLGVVLAFHGAMAMEFETGAWTLLWATRRGKRGVILRKWLACAGAAAVFGALPLLFRWWGVSRTFPLHGLTFAARSIPAYGALPPWLPAAGLLALKLLTQIAAVQALTAVVFALSWQRKSGVQALFFGLLILGAPLALAVLGFDPARSASLYPLYACTFT